MPISFDAAATLNFGATFTFTHTCAATATVLYVGIRDDAAGVSAVTYNSVAMTLVASKVASGAATYYLYRLVAPSSGAQTVSITTTSPNVGAVSASYIATRQLLPQDTFTTVGPLSTATISASLTATTANEWAVFLVADQSGTQPSANTNLIVRANANAATSMAMMDSNANTMTVGASFTMTANIGATNGVVVTEDFRPIVPSMLAVF